MIYPERFIDTEGYEWQYGPFPFEEADWRFRVTKFHPLWSKMRMAEKKEWDFATDEQLTKLWNIEVRRELT